MKIRKNLRLRLTPQKLPSLPVTRIQATEKQKNICLWRKAGIDLWSILVLSNILIYDAVTTNIGALESRRFGIMNNKSLVMTKAIAPI